MQKLLVVRNKSLENNFIAQAEPEIQLKIREVYCLRTGMGLHN